MKPFAPSFKSGVCASMLAVCIVGCGPKSELEKVIVSGDITFKGQPVDNGDILFYPMPGTKGPMSGASIKDGHYIANAKGGVPVGEHLVRISGFRAGGSSPTDDMMATSNDGARVQYLPAKYNDKSELRLKVDGGSAEMTQDYNLSE